MEEKWRGVNLKIASCELVPNRIRDSDASWGQDAKTGEYGVGCSLSGMHYTIYVNVGVASGGL